MIVGVCLYFASPPAPGAQPLDMQQRIAISGDGRTLVFPSLASNLVVGDEPDSCDLFARSLDPVPALSEPQPVDGPNYLWLTVLVLLVLLLGLAAVTAMRRAIGATVGARRHRIDQENRVLRTLLHKASLVGATAGRDDEVIRADIARRIACCARSHIKPSLVGRSDRRSRWRGDPSGHGAPDRVLRTLPHKAIACR